MRAFQFVTTMMLKQHSEVLQNGNRKNNKPLSTQHQRPRTPSGFSAKEPFQQPTGLRQKRFGNRENFLILKKPYCARLGCVSKTC
jgi:hypothetical protein